MRREKRRGEVLCALACPACRKYFPLHFPQRKVEREVAEEHEETWSCGEKPQRAALCQRNKSLRVNCAAQKTENGELQAAGGLISWERSQRVEEV